MKKIILTTAFAALSFGFTTGVQAEQAMSTAEIVGYCSGETGTFSTCEIYGQAVYDTYLVFSQHRKAPKFICVKQPAPSRTEVIQEYVAWTKANPKYNNDAAADSILRFLGERFPCGKSAK